MPLKVSYPVERGNTVPYPPLFDHIRSNHGFVDLRGRPDLAEAIPELADSPALKALVLDLTQSASQFMTMGCDLGEGFLKGRQLDRRWTAGGYVQVARLPLVPVEHSVLLEMAQGCERCLKDAVGGSRWEVAFGLCRTQLAFEPEADVEVFTLWIWVHAFSSTAEKARASREGAIMALHAGLRQSAGLTA
jgi:hypothetical protein